MMDEYSRFDYDLFNSFGLGYNPKKVIKKLPRCSIKDKTITYVLVREIYN